MSHAATLAGDMPALAYRPDFVDAAAGWAPPDDFPVVVNMAGKVVSRFRDPVWDLSPWRGKRLTLNFGDGDTRGAKLSPENARLLRRTVAWWMYGPARVSKAASLAGRYQAVKPLFAFCSEKGISADRLWRFPHLVDELVANYPNGSRVHAYGLLHRLQLSREKLGFSILDDTALDRFSQYLPERCSVQTAWIPVRIWTYQVGRLRQCLDEYNEHREQIEACYRFCLDAYAKNAGGSLTQAFGRMRAHQLPFAPAYEHTQSTLGRSYYGAFVKTAARFGIDELLERWVNTSQANGIKSLSSYLSLVSMCGLAYALNFSLMRVDEGACLRADCYAVDTDETSGQVHMLLGPTTKTTSDPRAAWIVAPTVEYAIEALKSIAALRMQAAEHHPDPPAAAERANPILQCWAYEPWKDGHKPSDDRKRVRTYQDLVRCYPKLFDADAIRITSDDLAAASALTPGLDPVEFAVGKPWPFAWHQLRRTGAVNMLASGLVSEPSLQFQLKHANRAMSRYYGKNYTLSGRRWTDDAQGAYTDEMYQSVARDVAGLSRNSVVSPYGEKRLGQILSLISEGDHKFLSAQAAAGKIKYRQTLFGGCANPGPPCPYGGVANLTQCFSSKAGGSCSWAVADQARRGTLEKLRDGVAAKLAVTEQPSPLYESRAAELDSIEEALSVLSR